MVPSTKYTHLKLNHDGTSGYVPCPNRHTQTHKKVPRKICELTRSHQMENWNMSHNEKLRQCRATFYCM